MSKHLRVSMPLFSVLAGLTAMGTLAACGGGGSLPGASVSAPIDVGTANPPAGGGAGGSGIPPAGGGGSGGDQTPPPQPPPEPAVNAMVWVPSANPGTDPDRVFAYDVGRGLLEQLDPETGAIVGNPEQLAGYGFQALAWDAADGLVLGDDERSRQVAGIRLGDPVLATASSVVIEGGFLDQADLRAMASVYDGADLHLFAIDHASSTFWEVDVATGALTAQAVADLAVHTDIEDMTFDPEWAAAPVFVAVDMGTQELLAIDLAAGTTSLLAALPVGADVRALAYDATNHRILAYDRTAKAMLHFDAVTGAQLP